MYYQHVLSSVSRKKNTAPPGLRFNAFLGGNAEGRSVAENRLIAVTITATGHVTKFGYDGMGRRVEIQEMDPDTTQTLQVTSDKKYLWDGLEIAEERDTTGGIVLRRFYNQGFVDSDGTVLFYTRDHLGSIRELTDGTQAIRGRYDYDPFGRMTKVQGDRDGAFGFTGDFWHAQSGLNLTLFRAYDLNLGRWVSRDPIGEMGGNNLYDYVLNSPTYFKDKYGLANEPPTNPNIPPPPGKPPVLPPDIVCEMCITSCRGTNVDPCGTLTCLEHCKWTACLHDADFGPAPGEKPPTWYAKAAQTAAPHAANWFETILQKMAPWMTF